MADEKKFALPDSQQFRAFYAQKRRRSRNSNIPIVVPITKNFINLLGDPPQAYYELATPWTAAGDFEVEVDILPSESDTYIIIGENGGQQDFIAMIGGTNHIRLRIANLDYDFNSVVIDITKLEKLTVIKDALNVTISTGATSETQAVLNSNFIVDFFGRFAGGLYFKGILSDVKLTDITTPANSLSFGLDELTQDYEYPTENVFGSERLTNNDFSNGIAGWAEYTRGTGSPIYTTGDSKVVVDLGGGYDIGLQQNINNLIIGETYKIDVLVNITTDFTTSNTITTQYTGVSASNTVVASNTPTLLTYYYTATSTGFYILVRSGFANNTTGVYEILDVSVGSVTNVLNYRNIALDVRETLTLTDGNWLGDERVVNGDFATDSDWTKQAGWTISGGGANSVTEFRDLQQIGALLPNYTYRVKVDIIAISAGVELRMWNAYHQGIGTSVGSKSVDILSNTDRLTFYTSNSGVTIDNASVKRLIEVA